MFKMLRSGMKCPEAARWQAFLNGRRATSKLEVDGEFGPATERATRDYQRESEINMTGVLDAPTFAQAVADGLAFDDPRLPPVPEGLRGLTPARSEELYGHIEWAPAPTRANPEAVKLLNDWERQNIVTCEIPQLAKIARPLRRTTLAVHRLAAQPLRNLWQAWEDEQLLQHVQTFDGLYVMRLSRGSKTCLSNHAYGAAFDVNARWNPLGHAPASRGSLGSVVELVETANRLGWWWRGHSERVDPMHYELAVVTP